MTLPTITLLLDDGTGSFPYDISRYLMADEGTSFNRGRADWQGGVTAGQLSLTLNNSDGRFTPGSTLIASPSPIKVDQRIRLRETVNGVTYTRFTGYVKSWPVEWPATVGTIAMSTITVTDAQARAERHTMVAVAAEEILADNPDAFWPLNDPVGSTTAAEKSGKNLYPAAYTIGSGTAITFGATNSPGSDSAPGATFAGGMYLGNTAFVTLVLPGYAASFSTTFSGANNGILELDYGSTSLYLTSAGALVLGGTTVATGPFNDGRPHAVAIRYTSTSTADVYVDGAQVATGVGVTVGAVLTIGNALSATIPFTGTIANVALWFTSPSAARMQAISGPYASEASSARAARLAAYEHISTGTVDTGVTIVPAVDTFGQSAWEALQDAVDAELGVAYINGSGTLDFHNRSRNSAKSTPDLTLAATSYVTPDVQPVVDDQQIINYFETTSSVTGNTQVVRNTTSEIGTASNPGHGRYPDSKTYLVSTDAEALDRANWIVANFAEPTTRYGTLTINLFAMPASLASNVLAALDIDCWLRVTGMASQNPTGTTADVVVQGFAETCTADSWFITCNVVLRSLYNALIIDDATYGVLDSSVARLGV